MQEIKEDLAIIKRDLTDIKVTLAVNTESLIHHVKRTETAERRLEKLEYMLIGLGVLGVIGGLCRILLR